MEHGLLESLRQERRDSLRGSEGCQYSGRSLVASQWKVFPSSFSCYLLCAVLSIDAHCLMIMELVAARIFVITEDQGRPLSELPTTADKFHQSTLGLASSFAFISHRVTVLDLAIMWTGVSFTIIGKRKRCIQFQSIYGYLSLSLSGRTPALFHCYAR